jgi:hypothetical protein
MNRLVAEISLLTQPKVKESKSKNQSCPRPRIRSLLVLRSLAGINFIIKLGLIWAFSSRNLEPLRVVFLERSNFKENVAVPRALPHEGRHTKADCILGNCQYPSVQCHCHWQIGTMQRHSTTFCAVILSGLLNCVAAAAASAWVSFQA